MNRAFVTTEAFAPDLELEHFRAALGDVGALASFVGYCRGEQDAVTALELEHYPGFTERAMTDSCAGIAVMAGAPHWFVLHRVGVIAPGEAIVLVAAASDHRAEAFAAVERLMDWLKTDAPLWKREHRADGARWIEPSPQDRRRRARIV